MYIYIYLYICSKRDYIFIYDYLSYIFILYIFKLLKKIKK